MKMGQGSSQPAHIAQDGDIEDDEAIQATQTQSNSPENVKRSKPEARDSASKRKRKSSQSGTSPLAVAPSEINPKPVKRKKIVDNLKTKDGSVPASNVERRVSSTKSIPLERAHSAAIRNDLKMSPSPALVTGDSQAKGRLNRTNGTSNARGATGAFKPAEVEALEDFKVRFCNSNGCSLATFDLMVQHGFEGPFPSVNGITKRKFWDQVRGILPDRDKRSVYRFMKRHFQASGQKPHQWTPEQEDELVALYKQHGPKWARIAEDLGRSADDVVQRWKNRLEHRDTMNSGPWSEAEFELMKTALRDAWTKMGAEGYDVGENIYEMDESLISWGQISTSMKHIRSRQQCADKWRGIKASMASLPGSQVNSRSNSRSVSRSATPSSAKQPRVHRSNAWVKPEDDESDVPEHDAKEKEKKSTPEQSTKKTLASPAKANSSPLKQQKNAESSDGSSSDSEVSETSSDPDSESESDTEKQPVSPTMKKEAEITAIPEDTAQKRSTTSSSDTGSKSNSSPDSEADSESSDDDDEHGAESKLDAEKKAQLVKKETISDETSGSSSSEEESESESESESTIKQPPSKRKHQDSSSDGAETQEDKRVKVNKEPASDDESDDSDDESSSSSKKQPTPAPKDDSSEIETDSSDSDNDQEPTNAPESKVLKKSSSPSGSSTASDPDSGDSSSDDSSSDESQDEGNSKTIKVEGEEVIPETPVVKQETASSTTSDGSDTGSEETSEPGSSDSDSE
ncbi:hypothetical protein BDV06DRAFT_205844 [Aspergillus oleicola]